jgi:hypothetical protein
MSEGFPQKTNDRKIKMGNSISECPPISFNDFVQLEHRVSSKEDNQFLIKFAIHAETL